MKKITFSLFIFCCSVWICPNAYSQTTPVCSLEDARGCVCPTEASSCDLLPDITIAKNVYLRSGGWVEYSQTDQNARNAGLLRLTVTTPNLGWGPITTVPTDKIRCGTEPFLGSSTGKCPDGNYPQRLINQRVYRKEGAKMTFYDRPAGYMVFHPTHNHLHTNDWEHMTLRVQLKNEPNPTKWPIVGTTIKTGFCLADLWHCSGAPGTCTTNEGKALTNADLPNFKLGGGEYSSGSLTGCKNMDIQGISVGYIDSYSYDLDDMGIRIPAESCNGAYQVVIEVDPLKQYLEQDRSNNVYAFPVFLTSQRGGFHPHAKMTYSQSPRHVCEGDVMTLTGSPGFEYLWSNGATTPAIQVTQSGTYSAKIIAPCGTDTTKPITLNFVSQPNVPTATTVSETCAGTTTTLQASGNGTVLWYETPTDGKPIANGNTFKTPILHQNKTYYATIPTYTQALSYKVGLTDNKTFAGDFVDTTDGYAIFDVAQPIRLKSVKVYAKQAGIRTIELRGSNGDVLRDTTLNVPAGESRISLHFAVQPGNHYQLGLSNHNLGGLFRHKDTTLKYPLVVGDVVSISAASAGLQYYYFFYDWEVEEIPATCANKRVALHVPIKSCTPNLDELTLSPNPSSGKFKLNVPFNTEGLAIKVYDLTGKEIRHLEMPTVRTDQNVELDLSDYPNGVYIVQLIHNGKTSEGKRIILMR